MTIDLYELCSSHEIGKAESCPLCRGVGFVKIGLTMGQVDRMVDVERTLQGDPGIPLEKRLRIAVALDVRLNRIKTLMADEVKQK